MLQMWLEHAAIAGARRKKLLRSITGGNRRLIKLASRERERRGLGKRKWGLLDA